MARVKLLYNPKAGDEDHSPDELISLIESKGHACEYASVKDSGWHKISNEVDFLIVAGGDGTVRKVIDKLLQRKLIDKLFPIAILPLGTANNLAKTLEVDLQTENAVDLWNIVNKRSFDVGKIYGLGRQKFMIEGLGFGVFPSLIKRMQMPGKNVGHSPEQELEIALEEFRHIIQSYKPCYCRIGIDGADHSGEYLMVEILNIRSIGPNLQIAPDGEVNDGEFEIVLAGAAQRDELLNYIENKLADKEIDPGLPIIKGRKIVLEWSGNDGHVDDAIIEIKKNQEIIIEVQQELIEFLTG